MIRKLLFLSTLAITFFPACASSQAPLVGTTTTTSATIPGPPHPRLMCTRATTLCAANHDCCSDLCLDGTCE
jgi:hypothetical protein